jgi:queuine tRNA-ribosyltransferase
MAAQIGLGADIIMAFDECTEYPADRARTKASMELTLRWAERSKKYFEEHKHEVPWPRSVFSVQFSVLRKRKSRGTAGTGNWFSAGNSDSTQSLFGIVQGGMDLELRKESAERTIEIGFPGYAIGGLSVGEPRERTREVIEATLEHLPKDKPRYVMGVGTPEEIVEYARLGVDMMDCVLAHARRAPRPAVHFRREKFPSSRRATLRMPVPSIPIAAAACAGATRGPTCGIFMLRMNCWLRS